MDAKGAILVTGSHRAGTTWVGRVLSEGAGLGYVHEPFNVTFAGSWLRHRPQHWYQHVDPTNDQPYADDVSALLRCSYPLSPRLREARRGRDLLTVGKQQALAWRYLAQRRRLLVKDPLALLATPWLAARFGMKPVVLVRHPAAFASSVRRLGWSFDFDHLTSQTAVLDQLPHGLRSQLDRGAGPDPLEQAALLWNVLYTIVSDWQTTQPDWLIVRHEDLAADPVGRFRNLFQRIGIEFDATAERALRHTNATGSGELPVGRRHDTTRNSASAARSWHHRLNAEEIRDLRERTEVVASAWYSESSWTPLS